MRPRKMLYQPISCYFPPCNIGSHHEGCGRHGSTSASQLTYRTRTTRRTCNIRYVKRMTNLYSTCYKHPSEALASTISRV